MSILYRSPTLQHSALAIALLLSAVSFAGADEPVDFVRDVQPIFAAHCHECHGSDQQNSGLRLDRRSVLLRGGDHGEPTIVPGKPGKSFLLSVIDADNTELRMPPEGDPLARTHVDLLRRWIEQGAPWPGQMDATADDLDDDHWSLQPIADRDGTESDLDTFVAAKLKQSGLTFAPPADAVTLLRRVTLTLTGLPPTPDEVNAFLDVSDDLDSAYARVVDRLLDSPRYGERWAQHWLDIIRWAETVGFETNLPRPNAWPYRDWVIQSLNEDKPYDRFVFEQIAGDTVGQDAALGFLVAGPANLPGQIGRDEEAMRQSRQDELDEVIRTVSQGILGLTIGCARCHNHKFDPILQSDYYAMQATFAGLSYGERRWRGTRNDESTARVPAVRQRLDQLRGELQTLRKRHALKPPLGLVHTEQFPPIVATSVRMEIAATGTSAPASLYEVEVWTPDDQSDKPSRNVALATNGASPSASSFALANQTRHFDNLVDGSVDRRQAFPWVSAKPGPAWIQIDFPSPEPIDRVVWDRGSSIPADYELKVLSAESGEWLAIADTRNRFPREDDTRPADKVQLGDRSPETVALIAGKNAEVRAAQNELNRLSAGPRVFAASFSERPDPTWLLRRGDPMQRGEIVAPAIPRVLGDLGLSVDEPERQRRLKFAEHLTDPDHPLTARVMVNRVWQHHFGTGLVDTPSDFGKMGSHPTHRSLLDWLAAEFVSGGWSLKQLHRKILISRTFRQSSEPSADALQIDADSRLFWRFPPRRLEAEAIRDSILTASGKLNLQMGGPGFDLFKQRGGLSDYTAVETFEPAGWRRMIYAHKIRMQAVDIFGAFDCPDAGQMKPTRTRSITPTQTFGLFNSPLVIRQSKFFADRVRGEAGDHAGDQVDRAFMIALSRLPNAAERPNMTELVEQQGLEQLCRVLINTSEFIYIQ